MLPQRSSLTQQSKPIQIWNQFFEIIFVQFFVDIMKNKNIIFQCVLPVHPWCGVCPVDDHLPGLFDAVHVCKSEHKRRKQPYYKSQKREKENFQKSLTSIFT